MKNSERILSRLEKAGGAVSEAIQMVKDPSLANMMTSVNIALSDLRRAVVRLQNGEDAADVRRDLREQLTETFE